MRNILIFLLSIQLVRCLQNEDNNTVLLRGIKLDGGVANGGIGGPGGDGGDAINTTGKAGDGGKGGNGGKGGQVGIGGGGKGKEYGKDGVIWWSSSTPKGSRTNPSTYKPYKSGSKLTQHSNSTQPSHPSQTTQPPKKPNKKPNKKPKPGKHQEEPPTGVPNDCLEGIPDDPPAQLKCELDALAERDQLDIKPTYPWSSTKRPGLIAGMKPGKNPNNPKPNNPTPTPYPTPTPSAKPTKSKDKGKGKGKGKASTTAHSTTAHSTTGRPSTSYENDALDSFDEILAILDKPHLKPEKPQKKPNDKPKDKPHDQHQDRPQVKPHDKPQDKPQDKPHDRPQDKPLDRPQNKPQEIHPQQQHKPQVDAQESHPGLKPSIDRPWLKPAPKPVPHPDFNESPMKPVFKPMKPHIPFLWPRPKEDLDQSSEDDDRIEASVEEKVNEEVVPVVKPIFAL